VDSELLEFRAYKTNSSASLIIYEGHTTRDLHVTFTIPYTILLQSYAGNRQKSYKNM